MNGQNETSKQGLMVSSLPLVFADGKICSLELMNVVRMKSQNHRIGSFFSKLKGGLDLLSDKRP